MNNRGNITIYLALILTVLMVFVTSILESARIISSKTRSYQISRTAIDACFSKYSKELFDDYGVFGLWKSKSELSSDYMAYINESIINTKDMLGLNLKNFDIESIDYLTDNNAENFVIQVDRLMKYKMTEDMINNIILKYEGLGNSDAVARVLDEITKYQDIVSYIDEDIFLTYENVELINEDISEIPTIINDMNVYLDKILSYEGGKSGLLNLKGAYEECYQRLSVYVKELSDCVDKICLYEENYEKYTKLAEKGLDNMKEVIDGVEYDCNEDVYKALETMVNEYDEQVVSLERDYFNMVHCKEEAQKIKEYYTELKAELDTIDKGIKEDSFTIKMNMEMELPSLDDFTISYDVSSRGRGKESILTKIQNLFSEGFLSLVVNDVGGISKEKINVDQLVSKRIDYTSEYKYNNYESNSELIRKILYTQYLFDYFSCYQNDEEKEKKLNCEVEYIIAGKKSDKKNMEYITGELVLLREGFNMAYIVTDKEKMMAAEGLAASIVGAMGITPLISITKWLIVSAWVTAESVVDVRLLLEGEDVSLIKTKSEWNTGLDNLDKFSQKQYKNKKKDDSFSLGYRDYLRILLLGQNAVNQTYRTLDIIEMNMINKYNKNFRISDCICRINISSEYRIKPLFNIFNMSIGNIDNTLYTIGVSVCMEY